MLFIFKDARRKAGYVSSNPARTLRLLPVDIVAKCLKRRAPGPILRLATGKSRNAGAITVIVNRP